MKIICSRSNLYNAINTVQKAVSSKSALPILEGILIKAYEDRVTLTGNDLEVGIEYTFCADVPEEGMAVLNSRIFGEITRKLPDADVTIESGSECVTIECVHASFKMNLISSEGFPELQTVEGNKDFVISAGTFKDIIRKTIFAVSDDENRPILTGVMFEIKEEKLTLVSIDGFRMAVREAMIEGSAEKSEIVVPGKTLGELIKIIDIEDDKVNINFSDNHILFSTDSKKMVSRLLEGEFPNYRSIIPKDDETSVIVKRNELTESLERAVTVLTDEKRHPVVLDIENDIMTISLNSENASLHEEIEVNMKGEKVKIGFNARFLLDALKAIDEEEIVINFRGSVGPCTIKAIDRDDYLYLIVPVKIKNR
jgi:DNA polymerase III subunit beta